MHNQVIEDILKRRLLITFLGLAAGLLAVLVILLFVPPVSKWAIRIVASSVLGHELRVEQYVFTLNRLNIFGTFDDNSTVAVQAYHLMSARRQATVDFDGSAALFSSLADIDLPPLPFSAQLRYARQTLTLQGQLLGGTLHAEMDLQTMGYGFALKQIDIAEALSVQDLPRYASGRIMVNGKGTASEDGLHDINLTSYDMKLETPLLSLLALSSLPPALPVSFDGVLQLSHGTLLQTKVALTSDAFNLSLEDARYDLTTGMYALQVRFENNTLTEIPPKYIDATAQGIYAGHRVRADMHMASDHYRLEFRQLTFDTERTDLHGRYRLSSRQIMPLNLTEMNELYGTMKYSPDETILTIASHNIVSPIRVALKEDILDLTASMFPLPPLLAMLNINAPLTGKIDFNATADLSGDYPDMRLKLRSSDLNISTISLPFELNATGNLRRIRAKLHANSEFWERSESNILFNISEGLITCTAKAFAVNAPAYTTPTLYLDAHIDLNRSLIEKTRLISTYDSLIIPKLHYAEPYNGNAHFALSHLQRMFPGADPALGLEGNVSIVAKKQDALVEINTSNLGRFNGVLHNDSLQLHGTHTSLETLLLVTGIPPMLHGRLQSSLNISPEGVYAKMHVGMLQPQEALKETIRPMPLTITAAFNRCNTRYQGGINVSAGKDTLEVSSMQIDLARQTLQANYRLKIPEPATAFMMLPDDLFEHALNADGNVSLAPQRQSFSLQSKQIVLKNQYAKMLDANASGPLPLRVDVEGKHEDAKVLLRADIDSDYGQLSPVTGNYDVNHSHFALNIPVKTAIFPGNTTLAIEGDHDANGTISHASALIQTPSASMRLEKLYLDMNRRDFHGDVQIELQPPGAKAPGRTALLEGRFKTQPELEGSITTEAFGGQINFVANDAALMVTAADVNMSRIEQFFVSGAQLKSGLLDADILLTSPSMMEHNISTLSGGVDVQVHALHLEGIEFDSYLETLRDTQDLSLFQGSFSELPIVRNVKTLPSNLLDTKTIRTIVPHARVALAVNKGKAVCDDCALATDTHRIAFAGDVDLQSRQFDRFYFALLNPEGCPYYMQRIRGRLSHPEVSLAASGVKVVGGAVVSLASNVTDAATWVAKTADTLMSTTGDVVGYVPLAGKTADRAFKGTGGALYKGASTLSGCTPFYLGIVAHPQKN